MSYNNGGKLITSGLIFCADAATPKSYISGSSTFVDLTGNGSSLTTTGVQSTSSYINLTNNTSGSGNATAFMVNAVNNQNFKTNLSAGCSGFITLYNTTDYNGSALSYYRQTAFCFGYDSARGGWHIARYSGSANFIFSHKFDQDPLYGTTRAFAATPFNQWTQLGFTLDNTNLKLFNNGSLTNTISTTGYTLTSSIDTTAALGMGAMLNVSSNGIYGYIGYISNAQFYSRKLSDAEVLQNYNALKGRFGLT